MKERQQDNKIWLGSRVKQGNSFRQISCRKLGTETSSRPLSAF